MTHTHSLTFARLTPPAGFTTTQQLFMLACTHSARAAPRAQGAAELVPCRSTLTALGADALSTATGLLSAIGWGGGAAAAAAAAAVPLHDTPTLFVFVLGGVTGAELAEARRAVAAAVDAGDCAVARVIVMSTALTGPEHAVACAFGT